jgi:hypothetical protein
MPQETDDAYTATNRATKRDSLFLLTEFCDEDGNLLSVARVRNLSATGLMADCDRILAVGDRVRLTLRGNGKVAATIVWAEENRVGLAFDHSIDPMAARRPIAPTVVTPAAAPFPAKRFSPRPR